MILAVHLYFDILCSFMIFGSALLFWHFVLICDFWSVLIICIYLCCFMIMAVFVFWHFVLIYDYGYEYGSVLVFFCVLLTNNVFLPFCCCCCCCQRSVNKKWACWLFVRVNFFLCSCRLLFTSTDVLQSEWVHKWKIDHWQLNAIHAHSLIKWLHKIHW